MHTQRLQQCKEARKGKESYRSVVYERERMQQRKNVNPSDQKIHLDKKGEWAKIRLTKNHEFAQSELHNGDRRQFNTVFPITKQI